MIGWTSHLNPDLSYKDLEQDKRQSSDHVAEILTQKTESEAAATLRHFKMCLTEERNLYLKKEKRQACGERGVETKHFGASGVSWSCILLAPEVHSWSPRLSSRAPAQLGLALVS